ncbi:MAG: chromosomal replication initiator protein DnaA [Christensenellaceae bacterium]|nr:chromosomal replication initiator protein DnaA [Christensenellaceae bacterium]
MNSFSVLWESTLKKLNAFYAQTTNQLGFSANIGKLSPEFEEDGVYYFKVQNDYYKESIQLRFLDKIREVLAEEVFASTGRRQNVEMVLFTPKELDIHLLSMQQTQPAAPARSNAISLKPGFTFESFVVGSSNQFAHAAALSVATSPGLVFNPLTIYGGVGLGKTHLMHAIGNRILEKNPDAKIIYTTTEAFTNEFIDSIQNNTPQLFRNKYRSVDVLMIDDIQFIAKAQRTQEELFHTFNTLSDNGKQLIFSSDKPPSEIPKLEERLLSRFNSGLLTDIILPDYETRVAILKNKLPLIKEQICCPLDIDDEVLHYIASREESNIRDLEGALKKVIAHAQLSRSVSSINMDIARVALKDFFTEPVVKSITPKVVIKAVCDYFDVTEADILGPKRSQDIVYPRQIIMYLLKTLTSFSNQKISESVGRGDHTTTIHAYDKISALLKTDPETQAAITDITGKIKE